MTGVLKSLFYFRLRLILGVQLVAGSSHMCGEYSLATCRCGEESTVHPLKQKKDLLPRYLK